MKLKCNDGIVRRFEISKSDGFSLTLQEAYCVECLEPFGVHDTHILKPLFKEHSCNVKKGGGNEWGT